MSIGSLFSGAGGLDLGVQAALGGQVKWHCDNDPAAMKVLAHHWPQVPNLGDITEICWNIVPAVHILAGGFPCQDMSQAGKHEGMKEGTRSGLWSEYLKAIQHLRPQLVIIENVRGILSACAESDLEPCPRCVGGPEPHRPVLRALGRVLGDLDNCGYDARWCGLPASAVGAAHQRYRIFLTAWPGGNPWTTTPAADTRRVDEFGGVAAASETADRGTLGAADRRDRTPAMSLFPTPRARDWKGKDPNPRGVDLNQAVSLLPTPKASDEKKGGPNQRGLSGDLTLPAAVQPAHWGQYRPAIERWAQILGRPAPQPTQGAKQRLSPRFCEWLMGLPEGHLTEVAGLSRNDMLKLAGNGVVPLQAATALKHLLEETAR